MATTEAIDVVMPQMGVSVSEGTITKWLKQEGEQVDGGRAAPRDLDRQGRHRGAEPRFGDADADPRARGRDGGRRHEARGDRRGWSRCRTEGRRARARDGAGCGRTGRGLGRARDTAERRHGGEATPAPPPRARRARSRPRPRTARHSCRPSSRRSPPSTASIRARCRGPGEAAASRRRTFSTSSSPAERPQHRPRRQPGPARGSAAASLTATDGGGSSPTPGRSLRRWARASSR